MKAGGGYGQRRKRRTVVREQTTTSTDGGDTPVKRRRVQHNYRRLSRAGYVDDYDGRERFSGKKTATAADSLSPKPKSVDPVSGPSTSKATRSRSKPDTIASQGQGQGQCVADLIIYFFALQIF